MAIGKLELIEWEDITSHNGGEWTDDPISGGTSLIRTAGWVTHENDRWLTVFSSISDGADKCYGHDTCIPLGCIVKRTVLRRK